MKPFIFCVFAVMMLTSANGGGEVWPEQMLQCFHCELGFWDACYTTTTNCSSGEKCYTGRGKAGDLLDIKFLGCLKEEECETETTVDFLGNTSVFVMTKYCCDTPFCNAAHTLPINMLLCLTLAVLTVWHGTEPSTGLQ